MKKYIITIVTVTLVVLILALGGYYYLTKDDTPTSPQQTTQKDNKKSSSTKEDNKTNTNNENTPSTNGKTPETVSQPTIINGIVLANKKHPLPTNYNPGENPVARQKVNKLISDAQALGLNVSNQVSGFRAYSTQAGLYNNYVAAHGKQEADRFSARPGYSEHQTGLVFDLIDNQGQLLGAEGTNESSKKAAEWLEKNAHKYGFIVRYKPEFVEKTGYMEESWHIRYVGEDVAKTIHERNISLEEYLNAPGGDYVN
jgi:serine-type D-Ala-D-Ala carboxypeptidase